MTPRSRTAAVGPLGPVALIAGATLPVYLAYRRLFVREDAALRDAVVGITAQVTVALTDETTLQEPKEDE